MALPRAHERAEAACRRPGPARRCTGGPGGLSAVLDLISAHASELIRPCAAAPSRCGARSAPDGSGGPSVPCRRPGHPHRRRAQCPALPRGSAVAARRLRRRRRLLRHLRVPHHRPADQGAQPHRTGLAGRLLRPARAPDPPGGPRRDRPDTRGRPALPPALAVGGPGLDGTLGRPERRELVPGGRQHRLLQCRGRRQSPPALLVAGRGGAVLPGLAAAADRRRRDHPASPPPVRRPPAGPPRRRRPG